MKNYLAATFKEVPDSIVHQDYQEFDRSQLGPMGFFELYDDRGKYYPDGAPSLSLDDLKFIPNEKNRPIITTEYYKDFYDQDFQEIALEYYDDLDKVGLDILVLNEDLQVHYTTMDLPESLSDHQVNLISGLYKGYEVSKMSFDNGSHTIVFYRKYSAFNRITNSLEGMRAYLSLAFVLIFIGVSVIYLFVLNGKVNKPVKLLTEAIKEVAFGNNDKIISYQGPREFENVCNSFNDMQVRLDGEIKRRGQVEDHKNKMLADISHDLKTPVTAIRGFTQALIDDKVDPDQKTYIYKRIIQRAGYMDELLTSFSDYSRLEREDFKMVLKETSLSEFLKSFFIDRHDEISLAGYHLDIMIEDDILYCFDAFMMTRVFENLLSNVYKYTPKDTTIRFSLSSDGQSFTINFSDDGPGIPEDIKATVFEAFVVGESSRPSQTSGIGLAIVRKIIDKHKGQIVLKDCPGTSYQIKLDY